MFKCSLLKKSIAVLCLILILFSMAGMYGIGPIANAVCTYNFDFGTATSPVMTGYTRITESTAYGAGLPGWTGTSLNSADRASGSDLYRDLVYGSSPRSFKVDLPNGTYNLIMLMGDNNYAHDQMSITVNGIVAASGLSAAAAGAVHKKFTINVDTGYMDIMFSDAGGSDPNWVINGIEISRTDKPSVIEAENCTRLGTAGSYNDNAASGGKILAYMDATGSGFEFKCSSNVSSITFYYATVNTGTISLYKNGVHNQDVSIASNGVWTGSYAAKTVTLSLAPGDKVKIQKDSGDITVNFDCILLPAGTTRIEAESCSKIGYAADYDDPAASGGKVLAYVAQDGDGFKFSCIGNVNSITLYYATPNTGTISLYIDGVHTRDVTIASNGVWTGSYASAEINISIVDGQEVKFQKDNGDIAINYDYITLPASSSLPVESAEAAEFNSDDVIVYDVKVNADKTGMTDATAAFQDALNTASGKGGGIVYAEPGNYRINGTLLIPQGVTLRGEWKNPDEGGLGGGTILRAYSGKDNENGTPFIRLSSLSSLKNISIWYPEQQYDNVHAYPATIGGNLDIIGYYGFSPWKLGINIMNVTLYNSYKGIDISGANTSQCMFKNIYGTVLKQGMYQNGSYDTPRYLNIKFGINYWANSGFDGAPSGSGAQTTLKAYTRANCTGIRLDHEDWYMLDNINMSDMNTGVHLSNMAAMVSRLTTNDVNIGLKLDGSKPGVQVAYSSINAGVGTAPKCIQYGNVDATDNLTISNTVFGGAPHTAVYVNGAGGGTLSISNCTFSDWGYGGGAYAVYAQSVGMTITKSTFSQNKKHIYIASSVLGAAIESNTFTGAPQIDNYCANTNINHSNLSINVLPAYTYTYAPERVPASTTRIVVVTNAPYNAKGDERTDNTTAFQNALNDVSAAGGGTVYVPAGKYKITGTLSVPSGVELRGCSDSYHSNHVRKGTELYAYSGKDNANGTPFISLNSNAGIRGITIFYPEQEPGTYHWYPWTIRGLGSGCWVKYLCLINSSQGIDMMSNRCDELVVSDTHIGAIHTGLQVGKGAINGFVENVNEHIGTWVNGNYPNAPSDQMALWNFLTANHTAYKFGACSGFSIGFNVAFCAHNSVQFVGEPEGSFSGTIYIWATDFSNADFVFDQAGNVDFILVEAVADFGETNRQHMVLTNPTFTGTASFYLPTLFGPSPSPAKVNGGTVNLVQLCDEPTNANGVANAGVLNYYSSVFQGPTTLTYNNGITSAIIRGCAGRLTVVNNAGAKLTADYNCTY